MARLPAHYHKYDLVTFDKKGRRVRQAVVHAPINTPLPTLLGQADWKPYTSKAEVWCDVYRGTKLVGGCDL
jgi:hypothetical protein